MTRAIATTPTPLKAAEATGAGMQAMLKSASTAARAGQTLGIEWVYFVKQSVEHSTTTAKRLAKADSLSAAMEIQSEFAKASYERLATQATTFRDLYAGFATEMAKPFQTLASRKAG